MTLKQAFAILAICTSPWASADIYKCIDAQGHKTYTDSAVGKPGCKLLDVPGGAITGSTKGAAPAAAPKAAAVAPSNFPKVDSYQQKQRDEARRTILQQELAEEQKRLEELKAEYNNGTPDKMGAETKNHQKYLDRVARLRDSIARTERNIAELQREISNIR